MLPVSVLLPVYHRVPAEQFEASLNSVLEQTQPVAELIIIADGPLTDELDAISERACNEHDTVQCLRLAENRGVAVATQAGLERATQPWIARQDADDISLPERFERMMALLEIRPDLGALGAAMYEFSGTPDNIVGTRSMPESAEAVKRYARFNNPVNNPTSIVHRERTIAAGGIQHLHLMEDYDLMARLIAAGHPVENLAEPLVLFRADPGMFTRRRDRRIFASEWDMQRRLKRYGLISTPRMLFNMAVRSGVRLIPASWFTKLYALVFRRDRAHATERA